MAFICSCSGEIEIPNFPTRKVQSSTKIQEVWGHNCSPITQAKTMKTSSFDPGISEYEVWIPVWGWSERSSPGVAVTFWLAHLFLALFGKCIADLHPFFCRASGLIGNIFGLDHVDFFRKSTTITHIHTYTYQYLLVIKSPKKTSILSHKPSLPNSWFRHPIPNFQEYLLILRHLRGRNDARACWTRNRILYQTEVFQELDVDLWVFLNVC